LLKKWLRELVPITKEFAKQGARQLWYWITVIHIVPAVILYFQQFSLVIDDQVQLEPIKPTHTGLSPSSKLCHYMMRPNTLVVTRANPGRIDEADSTALPKAAG
jgi:hypothetical protein